MCFHFICLMLFYFFLSSLAKKNGELCFVYFSESLWDHRLWIFKKNWKLERLFAKCRILHFSLFKVIFKIFFCLLVVREMAQQLRGLCVCPDDQSWVCSNHIEWLPTAAWSSCFKRTDTLFWPFVETCVHVPKHKDTHRNPYKENKIFFLDSTLIMKLLCIWSILLSLNFIYYFLGIKKKKKKTILRIFWQMIWYFLWYLVLFFPFNYWPKYQPKI